MRVKNFLLVLLAVFCLQVRAQQVLSSDAPFTGAQVFIEPGQTAKQIDHWFSLMQQNGMSVCRIRMFQQYMQKADHSYDFTLFDHAFESAQRHNIKIYCTFFPTTERTDIGGWKFPYDDSQYDDFKQFIKQLVCHYRQHPALKGWVLINEPGSDGNIPSSPFINTALAQWSVSHPEKFFDTEGYPILTAPRKQQFVYDYTASYLSLLAQEVRKYDTQHDIHINPANVFGNYGEYDWTKWQSFLTSLGGSAHPAWHYWMFPRNRFTHAMAIESEILRSAAGKMPWFMTEIQGGNNTYSGGKAICPTPKETVQWLWTVIGTEGKGGIFWSLNARSAGIEAGEWAMIDFNNKASDRLMASKQVSETLRDNQSFFTDCHEQLSGIDIVYTKESRWAENLMHRDNKDVHEGRQNDAVFKSIAACYKALADHGVQASVTSLDNYDFSQDTYAGRTIILSQQIALPHNSKTLLQSFVEKGGTLIVEGMSGYFDENLHCTMMSQFWSPLLGHNLSEFKCVPVHNAELVTKHQMPIHWQKGIIEGCETDCVENTLGKGKVVWLPSCVALGAWTTDNYAPLGTWLMENIKIPANTITYQTPVADVMMRVLYNQDSNVIILINKSETTQTVTLSNIEEAVKLSPIFSDSQYEVNGHSVTLSPEGTLVLKATEDHLADLINTSIGVIDKRWNNCVIGPRLPYSSISPSPQTPKGGMDGYNPQQPIMGFGQLHVSGTGWSSYGHFLVSPQTGKLQTLPTAHLSKHSADVTKAYYYSTHLDDYNIKVQLAPAHHSAMYEFCYEDSPQGHILLDAAQAIASDIAPEMHGQVVKTTTTIDADNQLVKMMLTYRGGWPSGDVTIYCVAKYDSKPLDYGTWKGDDIHSKQTFTETQRDNTHAGAYLTFDTSRNKRVKLKVAVSFVSSENAERLLMKDIAHWNFEQAKNDARKVWDNRLQCIQIKTDNQDENIMFYSSMFRIFTAIADRHEDNRFDPTGERPFFDDNYAYWDTYRTLYPLLMLVDHPTVKGNIETVIDIFKRYGEVTDGFIAGRPRKGDQGGNDIDHMLAEACLKDIPGIDWKKVYQIVKHNADNARIGYKGKPEDTDDYRHLGFIPDRSMSCSQTMEFAYNDYSAALMAKKLGHTADYKHYLQRSRNWQNLWNSQLEDNNFSGFIDAKKQDGSFSFFSPSEYGGSWLKPFYEGTSWLYSFYVPHDFTTLIKLMGGNETFCQRLQYGLEHNLINNSNEPGFLATFAFAHAGRPDLASIWAHRVKDKGYDLTGYPENDDTGSMTSWYVFVTTGLFPNAGQDFYYLIAPSVSESVYQLSNGKTLTIKANASKDNKIVKSCKFNGRKLSKLFISHNELMQGGILEFSLGSEK